MKLVLTRLQLDKDVTLGALDLDGEFQCWTCEDTVRPPGVKVPCQTAIPFGRYKVIVNQSTRFNRLLPLLLDVPNFAGVRIHPGNTAANTEGCILVGTDRLAKSIGRSRLAFDALFAKLQAAARRAEAITLEIVK